MNDQTVYVDAPIWPFGRMMMCHLFSLDVEALHAMASRIGVDRRWFQNKPGFPHYDICKSKRAIAVSLGAVEVDRRRFVELVRILREKTP